MKTGNKNENMNKVKISMKKKMWAEKKKYDKYVWLVLKRESKRHLNEYITENQQFWQKFLRMWLMYFFSDLYWKKKKRQHWLNLFRFQT